MIYQIFKIKKNIYWKSAWKFKREFHLWIDPQLYLPSKMLHSSTALSHWVSLFTTSKWKKMENCISILQRKISSVLWNINKFFCQFLQPHTCIHTHTLPTYIYLSFCTQCWLIQRRPRPRFHPHLTEIIVNIWTKHLSGTPHHLWTRYRVDQWTK